MIKKEKPFTYTGPVLLKIRKVVPIVGLSEHCLRKGVRDGTIPHVRIGADYMINVPLLIDMLNNQSLPGGD